MTAPLRRAPILGPAVVLAGAFAGTAWAQPLPGPGETVHWTIDISPITIASGVTIPAGGTVIVDPGVIVNLTGGADLFVNGVVEFREGSTLNTATTNSTLIASGPSAQARFLGTAAQPAMITGGSNYLWYGVEAQQGAHVRLDHADVQGVIHAGTFYSQPDAPAIVATNSTFTGGQYTGIESDFGTLVVVDCVFNGSSIRIEESFLHIDEVTLNGGRIDTYRRKAGQPIYFNNITASGIADDSPFLLNGFDHFFGPDNEISGNRWPVHLTGGGIAPGSVLPATGNTENVVNVDGTSQGTTTLPNIGLVYVSYAEGSATNRTIEPGVTVRMAPGVGWSVPHHYFLTLKGRHDAPIIFEQLVPGQRWNYLLWDHSGSRPALDWCVFRGAERAVHAYASQVYAQNCVFEDNGRGMYGTQYGGVFPRKCRFLNNDTGIEASPFGYFRASSPTNPNSFEGNAIGALAPDQDQAQYCWWGDPSGPQTPANPGGTGDPISGPILFQPFLTQPPGLSDRPPSVRLARHSWLMQVGQKVILRWEADDDAGVVAHRIEHSPHDGCFPFTVLVDDIPGSARAWVLTIPEYENSNCIDPAAFRVVAIDEAGQEGFDDIVYTVPNPDMPAGAYVPNEPPALLRPGQEVDLCATEQGAALTWHGGFNAVLRIDDELQGFSLGGTTTNCLPLGMQAPPVSTDLARVSTAWSYGAGNRYSVSFTPYFEVRPDPALTGDTPPTVQMLAPDDGEAFAFGGAVPIEWTASDDEGIQSFAIHASYDGGRTWHVIADPIPASQLSYAMALPPSDEAIADLRLRIIARDLRFQVTSDGADHALSITPGEGIAADLDGDGDVDTTDLNIVLSDFGCTAGPGNCPGDIDGDGDTDTTDLNILLSSFGG